MPEWSKDLQAMLKGWQVLIRGKLYYDQKTKQYYDGNMRQMTYDEVANRHRFDPMKPQEIYKGTAQVSPRTQEIMGWQPTTEGLPTGVPTEPTEQAEQERLAAQMGISVQDLLRYQYGVPVEEGGLTDWQLEQQRQFGVTQAWREKEAGLGLEQQREMTRQAAYNWGQQRYAHQLGTGGGGDIRDAQSMQLSKDWQAWQNRLAGEATWPQSEILRTQRNPYERTPDSIIDEAQSVKREYEFAKQRADRWRERMKDPDDPLTKPTSFIGSEQVPATMRDMSPGQMAAQGAFVAEDVAKRQYEGYFDAPEYEAAMEWKGKQERAREKEKSLGWGETWGRDLPSRQPPPMPATPAFLRSAYPELGERLPRDKAQAPMYPLSGQQWGRMLPSQQQKWAGYIGWAGGKPEDLYTQMQAMTPRYRPGTRWSPARQM